MPFFPRPLLEPGVAVHDARSPQKAGVIVAVGVSPTGSSSDIPVRVAWVTGQYATVPAHSLGDLDAYLESHEAALRVHLARRAKLEAMYPITRPRCPSP